MNIFRQLRRQMRVISNPKHHEVLGDFHLNFVGVGRRKFSYMGWWPTQVNFYVVDATNLAQRVRVPHQRHEFVRERDFVVLYAPNTRYEEYCSGRMEFDDAWVVFRAAARHNALSVLVRRNGYCVFHDRDALVREYIHEAAQIGDSDPGARWNASAAFLRVLALLQRSQPAAGDEPRMIYRLAQRQQRPSEFQERVLAILKEQLAGDISVEQLARRLGLSRSALTHRFSIEMGDTLCGLKNRLRIERAQEWIGSTDKTFKEIAFAVGFQDPAYFTRIFQNTVGTSPRDYRQLLQGVPGRVPPSPRR